jgi:hypothetical protein
MKNKKGFVFIETIIVIVVLSAALLIIYSSFNAAYIKEKKRVYYDDPSYIYKSYYLGKFVLENSRLKDFINSYIYDGNDSTRSLALILGAESNSSSLEGASNLFITPDAANTFNLMANDYHLYQLILLKPDFKIISKCNNKVIYSTTCSDTDITCKLCQNTFAQYSNIETSVRSYIKTLGSIDFNNYIFIMYYKESYWGDKVCDSTTNTNCRINSYFVWIDTGVPYD